MHKANGLTLIELIATISIIAITAAIAIPSFSTFTQNNRVKSASEHLYQSINHARTEAIKRNQNTYMSYQTGPNWCLGFSTTTTCSCNIANNCNLGQMIASEYPRVSFSATGFSTTTTTIDNLRGRPNQAGNFSFASNSRSVDITLSRMGRLKICGHDIGGYRPC